MTYKSDLPVIVMIPDTQVKPGVPTEHLEWAGRYIVDTFKGHSDCTVVHIGDAADMPSLSSYDKGKKAMEGRRYSEDIQAANGGFRLTDRPIAKAKGWKPRKLITLGNHECVREDARAFTQRGFVGFKDLEASDDVLSVSDDGTAQWLPAGEPHVYDYDGPLVNVGGVEVTPNHRVVGLRKSTSEWIEKPAADIRESNPLMLYRAAGNVAPDAAIPDEDVARAVWGHTDSHREPKYGGWSFYQRASKAQRVIDLFPTATEHRRTRTSPVFPNGNRAKSVEESVELYLGRSNEMDALVPDRDRLAPWVFNLSRRQVEVLLAEWVYTDGTVPTRATSSRVLYVSRGGLRDDLQRLLILNGYTCSTTEYRPGHWRLNVTDGQLRQTGAVTTRQFFGKVWCLTVPNGRFFVEQDGKVLLTGNSRIERAANDNAQLDGTVSLDDLDHLDWEVFPFLQPVNVHGVTFAHYFYNPLTGRPYAGLIDTQLKTIGYSFAMGHRQVLQYGVRPVGNTMHHGLVAGSFYAHDEEYLGPQGNDNWRGLIVMHQVVAGTFDPMFVSLDYLVRRYGDYKGLLDYQRAYGVRT